MKKIWCVLLAVFLFCGCSRESPAMDAALSLRQKISAGCSFDAEVTADYETSIQSFSLSCTADDRGRVSFTVTAPEEISDITGVMSENAGSLTFDDTALHFSLLADGQLSPVSAPWVLVHTLRSGCITSCEDGKDGKMLSIDDSYEDNALHLNITLDDAGNPVFSEIIWNGRRILSMEIGNFRF